MIATVEPSRKLTVILAADVARYSSLMAEDEAGTLEALNSARALFQERTAAYGGRVVDTAGDSVLAEFKSVVEAVRCAVELQEAIRQKNEPVPAPRRMLYRIGVNLGDVIEQSGALYGDGVNVAARLQALAEPGGLCISGTAFDQIETKLPLRFQFIGEQQVKNIPRPVRVYRLQADSGATRAVAPGGRDRLRLRRIVLGCVGLVAALAVALWLWQQRRTEPAVAASIAALPLPKGPRIAVLPFANLSGDPRQEYFADGMTEDIITGLSRFRDMFVIARNTTFQYKGKPVDVREVGKALGVQYVLEGSVRREQARVRVTAQLLDASAGTHLWADSYDRDLTTGQIFDIQDEITAKVVSRIGDPLRGVISQSDFGRARAPGSVAFDAYDCVLRAKTYFASFNSAIHAGVRECLERTVAGHPDYPDAWAYLALVITDEYFLGYNPRPNSLERAVDAGERAVALDPESQAGHWFLARALFFRHDLDRFLQEAERTVSLNPNNTAFCAGAAVYISLAGEWDRGKALIERALALNPNAPGWYHMPLFFYHYRKGEYPAALPHAQTWQTGLPSVFLPYLALAAAYGQMGRTHDARAAVDELLKRNPRFPENARREFGKLNLEPELSDGLLEGLRKAGMAFPEHADPMPGR